MERLTFPRYKDYKPSGFAWLGEIPAHWDIVRNKVILRERNEPGEDHLPILSVSLHTGVSKDEQSEEENARAKIRIEDKSSYKRAELGDIAYNMMRAWQGAIGVVSKDGMVSPAYVVARPSLGVSGRFLDYQYRTALYIQQMDRFSKGITDFRKRLYWEEFKQLYALLPPLDEQQRIANFLDQKTAEIDEAIAKKQRLIELLKEQKAILINQAVTKGLNPDAPMRDSGVAWIGESPEHWSFPHFRYCCSVIKDGLHHTPPKYGDGVHFVSTQHVRNRRINIEGATFISLKAYKEGHPRIRPQAGDVLITLVGSIGFAALIEEQHLPLSFTRHVGYVRCLRGKLDQAYLISYTESNTFKCFVGKNVSKTAQPSIYLSSLAAHKMPLPPIEEQLEIVQWLSNQAGLYDTAIDQAEQEIAKLGELKQVMISEAVTGKIKL